MIRLILFGILILLAARMFWRLMDGILEGAGGTSRRRAGTPAVKLMRDPICGTYVASDTAVTLTARGTTHYFCSDQCRAAFRNTR